MTSCEYESYFFEIDEHLSLVERVLNLVCGSFKKVIMSFGMYEIMQI